MFIIHAKIEEGSEGKLSFLANTKYEEYIYSTKSSICIVNNTFEPSKKLPSSLTLIKVENAYACFAQLLSFYDELRKKEPKIEQPSFISESAIIGNGVYIGAFAYIGENAVIGVHVQIFPNVYIGDNVKIGTNTVVNPGVSIYMDCIVGDSCIIHAGTVIGSDGFGFAPDENGVFKKVPQIGNVIIEDLVEIGSNTSIDRATMGSTIIRAGVKLDNLIQIAHNVEIGKNTVIASQTGISGSTHIAENVVLGGQVGVAGHIHVAKGSQIAAQSGITKTVTLENKQWGGSPLALFRDSLKNQAVYRRLPELEKRIEELEQQLKQKGS